MLADALLFLVVVAEKLANTGERLLDSDTVGHYTLLIGLAGAVTLMTYSVVILLL